MANVLKHERFARPPAAPNKRRRGRLPRGVVSFRPTCRLTIGKLAELVGYIKGAEDNGKRVRIIDYRLNDACSFRVESLDGPLLCDDGDTTLKVWVMPKNLRRVWTGLSQDELAQLSLWRLEVSHG